MASPTANEQLILDALSLQIWTSQPDGLLDFVNQFTCDYFGMTRERLVGEGWQNVIHPADLTTTVAAWRHALETSTPYDADFRLLRAADKTHRWHHVSAKLVTATDGSRRWVGSNVDIDEKKRAEEVRLATLATRPTS